MDQKNSDTKAGTKLFIGGLSWDTTDVGFAQFFSRFGEVLDSVVMRNRETGRSRGFGFVVFADPGAAERVMTSPELTLDDRKIDPKYAVPREEMTPDTNAGDTNKLFVGGVSIEVTQSQFQEFFSQFGNVTDAVIMTDHNTGMSRGFGFVTFESTEIAQKVLAEGPHTIGSKMVECKAAVARSDPSLRGRSGRGRGRGRGGRGGRGDRGGRGGRGGRGWGGYGGRFERGPPPMGYYSGYPPPQHGYPPPQSSYPPAPRQVAPRQVAPRQVAPRQMAQMAPHRMAPHTAPHQRAPQDPQIAPQYSQMVPRQIAPTQTGGRGSAPPMQGGYVGYGGYGGYEGYGGYSYAADHHRGPASASTDYGRQRNDRYHPYSR